MSFFIQYHTLQFILTFIKIPYLRLILLNIPRIKWPLNNPPILRQWIHQLFILTLTFYLYICLFLIKTDGYNRSLMIYKLTLFTTLLDIPFYNFIIRWCTKELIPIKFDLQFVDIATVVVIWPDAFFVLDVPFFNSIV